MSLPMKSVHYKYSVLEEVGVSVEAKLMEFACVVINDCLWRTAKSRAKYVERNSRTLVISHYRKTITDLMWALKCKDPR